MFEVGPFELAHILKAHNISVHMRYHMSLCPLYNSKKYTKSTNGLDNNNGEFFNPFLDSINIPPIFLLL